MRKVIEHVLYHVTCTPISVFLVTCYNFSFNVKSSRLKVLILSFYRAMHFSAKRGIAIACRLSVRLSVLI